MKGVIEKYVKNLTVDEVKMFIEKSHYNVKEDEIKTIYNYIKNYWEDICDGNMQVFNNLKKDVCENTYNEIIKMYNKYKKFI